MLLFVGVSGLKLLGTLLFLFVVDVDSGWLPLCNRHGCDAVSEATVVQALVLATHLLSMPRLR